MTWTYRCEICGNGDRTMSTRWVCDECAKPKSLVCPFCHEGDFDLKGLKHHLAFGWCDVFEREHSNQ